MIRLAVASAGLGLVEASERVPSYSATFARGKDCVCPAAARDTGAEARSWWANLRSAPTPRQVPRLVTLSAGPVVIAASSAYLSAMADEIQEAIAANPDNVIISTVGTVPRPLVAASLPVDGRLRSVLGGTMQALAVRLAVHLLENVSDLTLASARQTAEVLMSDARPLDRFNREALTDEQVLDWLNIQLQRGRALGHSTLLRKLRADGYACEQTRFRQLHERAVEQVLGSRSSTKLSGQP